jgi:carbamoyl-phosphate synthase large subunit
MNVTTDPMEALRGQRVVVTGGAGVIATELLRQLSAAGAEVLSVDRLPVPEPPAGVTHLVADLAVADLRPIAEFRPRYVLHLAATFERSVESPEFWEQNWTDNVVATHRLVELAATLPGVDAFVFASSYLIYDSVQYMTGHPAADGVALREDAGIGSRNLCGAAKLYGEAELRFAEEVQRVPFRLVNARIFRVYGRGSRDVVSRWVRAALAGETIDVYHAENRFDYVFSRDVAEGLLRMALTPGARGVLNLATGRARPVSDVIAAIERATGRPLPATTHPVDEPYEASRADTIALEAALGWKPSIMLEEGVEWLVAFERAQRAGAAAVG